MRGALRGLAAFLLGAVLVELLDRLLGRRLGALGFRLGIAFAEQAAWLRDCEPIATANLEPACGAPCPGIGCEPGHVCVLPASRPHHMHQGADGDRWWTT